jgi:hypothetical protein
MTVTHDPLPEVVRADKEAVLAEQSAVDVLHAFTLRGGIRLSLPQVALRANLDLATAERVLADLEDRGAITKEDLGEGRLRYRLKSPTGSREPVAR